MRIRRWQGGPAWPFLRFADGGSALKVVEAVRRDGDAAVRRFTLRFDGRLPQPWSYGRLELLRAAKWIDPSLRKALTLAASRIRRVAEAQSRFLQTQTLKDACGTIRLEVRPLSRAGVYAPGGRYPLLSTVLMGVIPAKVAGVKEVLVCSPAGDSEALRAAAGIAGADALFAVGGAQAVAAMALGTRTIPRVDKIVGPGNRHVTAAKVAVRDMNLCGIDGLAGPSELLVLADDSARADWIAADLLAQAEHDPEAKVAVATTSTRLAKAVLIAVRKALETLPTKRVAAASLRKGTIWLLPHWKAAAGITEETAPEHLLLYARKRLPLSRYGTLFVGERSSVAFGDYVNGPNHTLPTDGTARWASGLSPLDFLRLSAVQTLSRTGVRQLGSAAARLATVEGLVGHKRSVEAREDSSLASYE